MSAFNITKKFFKLSNYYTVLHIILTPNRGLKSNPNTVYCSGKIFRCIIYDSFDCDDCEEKNQALRFHGNYCFQYCFVTVVLKLDISYKYNYFPNLSFCQIFSNKCGVNSSWIRRRAGDPCGLSLEWSEAMWWLSTSEERLDNSTNIFC